MKTFIAVLNLATLTVNAVESTVNIVDSLASLVMKKQAAKVMEAAGGVDEATIKQNIRDRLAALSASADPADLDAAAEAIYKSGYLYSFPANIVASIIKIIKDNIKSKGENFLLSAEYTDAVLSDYIKLCDSLNLEDKAIEDLVVFANRKAETKYISPGELTLRTEFYVNEILTRGFPAGFVDLTHYQSFCDAIKNTFLQNINNLGGNLSEYLGSIEYTVGGSAAITWKSGDPNYSSITVPNIQPDDIDLKLTLNSKDYGNFVEEFKKVLKDLEVRGKILPAIREKILVRIAKTPDKLQYSDIFNRIKMNNSNFTQTMIDASQPFTTFIPVKGKTKIGFAIVLKGGAYDNLPEIGFKF